MPTVEGLNGYDILAPHYDAVYNARLDNRAHEIEIVSRAIRAFRPEAQSLLDLGTGTGTILAGFKDQVDELVGLDISQGMLEVARANVPEATLVEADMTDFELGLQVDAAICMFNAINHIRSFDKWRGLFEKTAKHLKPGGIFIFDMISTGMIHKLAGYQDSDEWGFGDGKYLFDVEQDSDNEYVVTFTVELEEDGAAARAVTGSMRETVYPVAEVSAAANEYLEPVAAFDFRPGLLKGARPRAVTDNSVRPTFVYQKPLEQAV